MLSISNIICLIVAGVPLAIVFRFLLKVLTRKYKKVSPYPFNLFSKLVIFNLTSFSLFYSIDSFLNFNSIYINLSNIFTPNGWAVSILLFSYFLLNLSLILVYFTKIGFKNSNGEYETRI
jgi:hypothetical protein